MRHRAFLFKGSNNEYIKHLEKEVLKLRSRVQDLEATTATTCTESTVTSHELVLDLQTQEPEITGPPKPYELEARKFLSLVPGSNEEWLKRREGAQLSTQEQIIDAFHLLTCLRRSPPSFSGWSEPGPQENPLDILQDYSNFARGLQVTAEFSTRLSTYSTMLFYCLCAVARENGVTVDKVDDCTRRFLGNPKLSSKYLSRLRKASVWAAQVMEKLERTLAHRAPELFLLVGNGMTMYRAFSSWPEQSFKHLTDEVIARTQPFHQTALHEPWVSFSPTFLVNRIGPWSLKQVNKALGTNLSEEECERRGRFVRHKSELLSQNSELPQPANRCNCENETSASQGNKPNSTTYRPREMTDGDKTITTLNNLYNNEDAVLASQEGSDSRYIAESLRPLSSHNEDIAQSNRIDQRYIGTLEPGGNDMVSSSMVDPSCLLTIAAAQNVDHMNDTFSGVSTGNVFNPPQLEIDASREAGRVEMAWDVDPVLQNHVDDLLLLGFEVGDIDMDFEVEIPHNQNIEPPLLGV